MELPASVWTRLDGRRRIAVAVATLAVVGAVLVLGRFGGSRDMALLYAGLEGAAAGGVVTALEGRGVGYEVRGSAIYVDSAARDELRMTLAAEGLPASGSQGYELLDSLSGFGTTSQMFDAAYRRAKEGELARTIVTSSDIAGARVHISVPAARPFRRGETSSAAVTVTGAAGPIGPDRAEALRYLVASAVAGLAPEDVAVIDSEAGLIASEQDGGISSGREEALRARVERLLEARVGYGKAIVELTLEAETETEQITERRFDPEGRVPVSTEVRESSESASDSPGGKVTVASNLPQGAGTGETGSSKSTSSETRQLTNFEVSETQREVLRGPGAIRKISVAVLVDGVETTDAATGETTVAPRSDAELADLRELVASAVGYDENRGDVITLRSLPFDPQVQPGTGPADLAALDGPPLDLEGLVRLAIIGGVAVILGVFVVRPLLAPAAAGALPAPASAPQETPGSPGLPPLAAEPVPLAEPLADLPTFSMAQFDDHDGGVTGGEPADLSGLDPVSRLRKMIEERQDETVQILQSWVEAGEREDTA